MPSKIIVSERAHYSAKPPVTYSRFGWERSSAFGPVTKAASLDTFIIRTQPSELLAVAGDSKPEEWS